VKPAGGGRAASRPGAAGLRRRLARYRKVWKAARGPWQALGSIALYAAVRLWVLIINCFPVELNLCTGRLMGRIWWLAMKRHRERALANLRPALGAQYDERQLKRIAQRSFEHFAQLYLIEMAMTPRLITHWSWAKYVELGDLGAALRELLSERGTILLTAHFGNFELLGYVISRLGLPLNVVMRPLDNPLLNEYLMSTRASGGLSLLLKRGAAQSFDDVLARGGALCFIADQDAGRKGVFADFFSRKASWYKSIGLLAMHRRVPIIVGSAARVRPGFHYRIEVQRIIRPEEWEAQEAPLEWITQTYAHALEQAIRRHPEQYLWVHRRWKTRPKDEQPFTAA
jgi:KDO2-lipid IV(A) lauroyltransferase